MNEIVKKNGITYGVITGLVSVLITTLIYTIDLNLFTSMWVGFGIILFYIIIGIVIVSKTKKDLKGVITFKEAFTTYFISALIGIIISVAFNIILFNFIDPAAKETIKELVIKSTVGMMEKFGTPTEAKNEAIKKLQESDQFSIIELLKGSIFSILFSAVFGLILAAIFKTKTSHKE
jgi:hypothetical protein